MRRRAGVADFPRMPGFLLDRIEPRPVMLRHSGSDPVPYFHTAAFAGTLVFVEGGPGTIPFRAPIPRASTRRQPHDR